MNTGTFVNFKDLPEKLQSIVRAQFGVTPKTIHIEAAEKTYMPLSGDGRRSKLVLINLETFEYDARNGEWGGPNMFVDNPMERHDAGITIPPNFMVLLGHTGYKPICSIIAHPSNMTAYLSAAPVELTEGEKAYVRALSVIGIYRKEMMDKINGKDAIIASLLAKGLITKAGKGYGLTAEGKNVMSAQRLTAY